MANETPTVISELDAGATKDMLPDLEELFDGAYHDSHMFRDLSVDLEDTPDPFRLFLATLEDQPVGVAVVERRVHDNYEYLGFPPIHLKRFVVASIVRGTGLSSRLLDASKSYAFNELGLDILFGESNEFVALSRYGEEGAYYRRSSIEAYSRRNTPEQALLYFAVDITDPRLRGRRYPNGGGMHFAFPANDDSRRTLEQSGFISRADVLRALK